MHPFPSSQLTGCNTHAPVAGSQAFKLQTSPPPQILGVPWQAIDPDGSCAHASPMVQARPSSHGLPGARGTPRQAPAPSHASADVHEFRSSHGTPAGSSVPAHRALPSQASPEVHADLSSQLSQAYRVVK